MIARCLTVAIAAGFLAGVFISLVQMYKVTPLIHQAEVFEAAGADQAAGHGHDHASHDHGHGTADGGEAWAPGEGLERIAFTWMANILTGVAYGLLLVAGFALSGRKVDVRQGLLWGLAGFIVFALWPAVLLPPEVPGAVTAPLAVRQLLWFAVVVSTAVGIALLVFNRSKALKALGVVLIILPLALPSPQGEGSGSVPPELSAQFVVVSLGAAALFWVLLGGLTGALYKRYVV